MFSSLRVAAVAATIVLTSSSAWSLSTAQASVSALSLSVEDLTPYDGIDAFASLTSHDLYGYVEHELNGGPYVSSQPFTTAPATAQLFLTGVFNSEATTDVDGNWNASASLQAGSYGFVGAGILDSYELHIASNTRVTLQVLVSAVASTDDPLAFAIAYGNVQLDVSGDSFLDQVTAFATSPGSNQESRYASVSFATGADPVVGSVYRVASANPFQSAPAVPEPSASVLLLLGFVALIPLVRKRTSRAA